MTNKTSPESFIENLEVRISEDKWSFITNMYALGIEEDKSFCEWIQIFSAWMEWNEGDCEENYD